MSHSDGVAAVEGLIVSACLCTACIEASSGLPAQDVDIALRVLLRTRSAELSDACDACRKATRAFKAINHT
jgi:hypothetical protein